MPTLLQKQLNFFTVVLLLLASACGWHLRGALVLPPDLQSMYISARDNYSGITVDLKRTLESNGIKLAGSSVLAQMTMHIIDERHQRRTATVSAGGLASEYELSLEVDYKVTDSNNNLLIPLSTATVIRTYNFDPNTVTSAAQEERVLQQEMRADIIQQMARRLRFMKPLSDPDKTDSPAQANQNRG